MECPICHIELKIADRQGVEIDYCPQCRGVWLDRGELDKLIERSALSDRRSVPSAYRDDHDSLLTDDDDHYKYKNDERYRSDDVSARPKKKSFLGDIFDIFD